MLIDIIIPHNQFIIGLIAFCVIIVCIGFVAISHSKDKYKEGLSFGKDFYYGRVLPLDDSWVGGSFWIGRVLKQVGNPNSTMNYEYLLESYSHPESDMARVFMLNEEQYQQLLIDGHFRKRIYFEIPNCSR
jgi:hypothetical protein